MKDTLTFLPYIRPKKGIGIDFSFNREYTAHAQENQYPFIILDDANPLVKLVRANLLTDTGAVIQKVAVLLQKDNYSFRERPLHPLTNDNIDKAWGYSFSFYRARYPNSVPLLLDNQLDGNGLLKSFLPMLYCRHRNRYFDMVCPRCGQPLELCKDDDMLVESGLERYSRSSKRYLFCNRCISESGTAKEFYVFRRISFDPSFIKDRSDIIQEYSYMALDARPNDNIPCSKCTEKIVCFGTNQKARLRIMFFSFYPFYALVFPSVTLSVLDFSLILSKASPEDIANQLRENGNEERARNLDDMKENNHNLFHFINGPQVFLEVLYLKLTLLAAIFQNTPDGNCFGHPDLTFSGNEMWVKIADQASLLPSLWTFTVQPLALFENQAETDLPVPPGAKSNLLHMALAWYNVLIGNNNKTSAEIVDVIKKYTGNLAPLPSESRGAHVRGPLDLLFPPTDIFWNYNPSIHGDCINGQHSSFWQKGLELGTLLLKAALYNDSSWSKQKFHAELEMLRSQIHTTLFDRTPVHSLPFLHEDLGVDGANGAEKEKILQILRDIIAKCNLETGGETTKAMRTHTTGDKVSETIIYEPLPHDDNGFLQGFAPQKTTPGEGDFEKTLLLTIDGGLVPLGSAGEKEAIEARKDKVSSGEDDMEPTVILSLEEHELEKNRTMVSKGSNRKIHEEMTTKSRLCKTKQIVKPAEKGDGPVKENAIIRPTVRNVTDEEIMTETVILSVLPKDNQS